MNKLPNEILHKIFIRVPFKERLKCMLVCHHWYNALLKRSLLYDVKIDCWKMFEEFMDMMEEDSINRGDQVEILDLVVGRRDKFDYQRFCSLFPNLRDFKFEHCDYLFFSEDLRTKPRELENVNSKLEVVRESFVCGLTRSLIKSNTCFRLRSLELEFDYIGNPGDKLFVYLKNAPALEKLTLCYSNIRIEDCEILHENTPNLKTFHLRCINLNAGEIPRDVAPATFVESFSMYVSDAGDFTTYPNWYEYLAKKYTNLIDFEFEDEYISNLDANQSMTTYRDGILPLYKNIRKQLDTFNVVNAPTEIDIFNKLNEFGVRFERFNFEQNKPQSVFTQLAESNLSMYAKYITMQCTTVSSPVMLQKFTSLKSLRIDPDESETDWDINLTDYLNAIPPTLTSFTIYFTDIQINELPTYSNNIEELCLYCGTISPKLGKTISNYFPKLDSLTLSGYVREDLNVDLSNNHFKKLFMHAYFDGDNDISHGFSVTTSKSQEPQYFKGEKRMTGIGDFMLVPAIAEDLQNRVNIDIKCASVDISSYRTLPISYIGD